MIENKIDVFLGDDVEDPNEQHVLQRLRVDLADRGVSARIHANFHTLRRGHQRQIDFLVVTEHATCVIELKCPSSNAQLLGPLNGPWQQVFSDGEVRDFDRNTFAQVRDATYSLSDDMRALARRGEVPAHFKFYKHLDQVVCLYPRIPSGSRIDPADHIAVVDYDGLIERLTRPGGRRPDWTTAHWDAFARALQLRRVSDDDPDPTEVEQRDLLEDYRRRFLHTRQDTLPELVALGGAVDGVRVDAVDLEPLLAHAALVTLTGPSGAGKSHVATHAAVELARRGALTIWVRCDDARPAQLSALLARATAPYSTTNPITLIDGAAALGRETVLIVDGLNERPPQQRPVILEQLASLRLRHRLTVLVTSTDPVIMAEDTRTTIVALAPPDAGQRRALLAAYGAERPDEHSEAFTTPYELSLAAECARDLGPDATRTELFRAYVRRRCPSMASRAVLRRLARELDTAMSASLPLDTAISHLERSTDPRFSVDTLDEALNSPLLVRTQGRVRFRHELLGRFCAAEDLVARAASGDELVELFTDPRHQDLVEFAGDLETEPARRYALVNGLGDPRRLRAGLLGHLGPEVQHRLHTDVRAAFAAAGATTATARLDHGSDEPPFVPAWDVTTPLPHDQQRLLAAAAPCVEHGLFVDEVAALLAATDDRGDAAIADLSALGDRAPITGYVSATYGLGNSSHQAPLPATTIAKALEHRHVWRRHDSDGRGGAASALWRSGYRRGWGLLYAALELVDPDDADDQALFPDLLETAWATRGYHLQLAALTAAQQMSRALDGTERFARVRDFLLAIPAPSHWGLSSALVDTLTSYDAIECEVTLDGLREDIRAILRAPAEPDTDADGAAFHVFSSQFENENIVGPYSEAIAELTPAERTRLWVRAARGRSRHSMFVDVLLRDMTEHAAGDDDEQVLVTLHREANHLDVTANGLQDQVSAHVTAVVLLARFTDRLDNVAESEVPRVWRLVDQLLFAAARQHHAPELEATPNTEQTWSELLTQHPSEALNVLLNLGQAQIFQPDRERPWLSEFTTRHADHLRRLLTWAVEHPDQLVTATGFPIDRQAQLRLAFQLLSSVGDNDTALVLEPWVTDPNLGEFAVEAIRQLRGRT